MRPFFLAVLLASCSSPAPTPTHVGPPACQQPIAFVPMGFCDGTITPDLHDCRICFGVGGEQVRGCMAPNGVYCVDGDACSDGLCSPSMIRTAKRRFDGGAR